MTRHVKYTTTFWWYVQTQLFIGSRNEGKVWIFENPNTKAGDVPDVPAWDMCASQPCWQKMG